MTIFFNNDVYFQLYRKSKLFVVVRVGAKREPHTGWPVHAHHKHVLARGRAIDDHTLRVTRNEVSLKQIREWFDKAGYKVKVVGAKRR